MTKAHFLNVGQGNMVVLVFPDDKVMVYDCNINDDNEESILAYLKKIMPHPGIDIFVNSHRDADHTCGIKTLNNAYPIKTLWDSGVCGNTTTSQYQAYMDFRRNVPNKYEVGPGEHWHHNPSVRILNGKRDDLSDINAQSIVLHIDHEGSSLLLAGDTNASVWQEYVMGEYGATVSSLVLYGSHHGSYSFFNDSCDDEDPYLIHVKAISPAITILSVGDNAHGHPHDGALKHYQDHSYGADNGQKIFRTDLHGNMLLELHGGGKGQIAWRRT